MPYIQVQLDKTVKIAGMVLTPEMKADGDWKLYNGILYTFSFWDGKKIINATTKEMFEFIRDRKAKEIRKIGSQLLRELIDKYSEEERETWNYQQAEAEAFMKDNTVTTPYCDIISQSRGIDRVIFLNKVVENITAFKLASATIIGEQQKYLDEIYSDKYSQTSNVDALFNLKWEVKWKTDIEPLQPLV